MDVHSKQIRSYNMSRIRSKDSKPESMVRHFLFLKGFRYRKNVKKLPGCPDIVLKKYKTVIFVNGCFWHMHNCKYFVMPKSNEDFWRTKIERNKQRDVENLEKLKSIGWRTIVIWECQLKKDFQNYTLDNLINQILSTESNDSVHLYKTVKYPPD